MLSYATVLQRFSAVILPKAAHPRVKETKHLLQAKGSCSNDTESLLDSLVRSLTRRGSVQVVSCSGDCP